MHYIEAVSNIKTRLGIEWSLRVIVLKGCSPVHGTIIRRWSIWNQVQKKVLEERASYSLMSVFFKVSKTCLSYAPHMMDCVVIDLK